MSETQEQQPTEIPEQSTGIAWGDPISPEWLTQLKEMFERQKIWASHKDRDIEQSAFNGVLLTGADVFWLAVLALAEQENSDLSETASGLRKTRFGISLGAIHLERADLREAQLAGAYLSWAHLADANLFRADLEGAELYKADLVEADLSEADLAGANLIGARLQGAFLSDADLAEAELSEADLAGANLYGVLLAGATLNTTSFDKASQLNEAELDGAVLDQVIFDNTNLTVVPWDTVHRLGDEHVAKGDPPEYERRPRSVWKAEAFHEAARAYRSLAVALRNQGLGADATRFHYRAELMERRSYFWQIFTNLRSRRFYMAPAFFGRWLFSWLLGTFAGYGDYFGRLLLTYVIVVSTFAGLMFLASGNAVSFDSIRDVFVLSITSFHGRGVQPPGLHLNDGLATLTAVEAFFGLLIEGIFIAAFTRRVTGN